MLEGKSDRSSFLKKSALLAAGAAASGGALLRGPSAEAAVEGIDAADLDLWAYTGGAYIKTHQLAVNRYERKYGGKVSLAQINAPGAYAPKLQTAIAGHVPPDVGALGLDPTLRPIISSGAVIPLDSYLKTGFPNFYPNSLPVVRYKGKIWAVPTDVNTLHIAYNTQIFKNLNLTAPRTIAEMKKVLETLHKNNIQGLAGSIAADVFYAQLAYTDPTTTALAQADAGKIKWTSKPFLQAAQIVYQYVQMGLFAENATTFTGDTLALLQQSKIAFLFSTGNFTDAILPKLFPKFKMNEMPFPAQRAGQALRTIGGPAEIFAVFADSKSKADAVNLLRLLTDQTGRTELVAHNFIPAAPTTLYANKSALYKYYLHYQKTAAPRFIFNANVAKACDQAVQDMVNGKINPQQFVAALQAAA